MTEDDRFDDEALAAEYALHLLPAAEREAFEKRLLDEPELRDLLRSWDESLIPLSEGFPEFEAPSQVKVALDARLFGSDQKAQSSIMRWLFGGGAIAVLAIAAVVFLTPVLQDPFAITPTHSAEVTSEAGDLVIAASFSASDGALIVRRSLGTPAAGRTHEMWLIPKGADVPISLGVIPEGKVARVEIPQALRGRLTAALFAVSDEPLGGSPTGQPTGAVLAAGEITRL